jgi:hypothetical protein
MGSKILKRVPAPIEKSIVFWAKSGAPALRDISFAICIPFIFLLYANVLQRTKQAQYL